MEKKTEIKKLVIEVDGKEITLALDKAEKLFEALKELFDKKVVYIPGPTVYREPYRPWYWRNPDWVWCSTSGTKFTLDGETSSKTTLLCDLGSK